MVFRNFYMFAFVLLSATGGGWAQESTAFNAKSGWSINGSYAANSGKILIGDADDRTLVKAGVGYTKQIKRWSRIKLSYEGSLEPFYQEADPLIIGATIVNPTGPPTVYYSPSPYRPIFRASVIGETNLVGIGVFPIYAIYGKRERTYAFSAMPFGGRVQGFPGHRIQPTLSVDLGALVATRNIPVDYTSSFNFLSYAGPGVEVYWDNHHSVRIEYLYEHMSNAGLGYQNPGLDSATWRITLTRYR